MRPVVNDAQTVERFMVQYWRFALCLAHEHISKGTGDGDSESIISDALFGLFDAARSYDVTRGTPPLPYARMVINHTIIDGYRSRMGRFNRPGRKCEPRPFPLSLDVLSHIGAEDPNLAVVEDKDETASQASRARALFNTLTPTAHDIMRALYVHGRTQTQIAAARGVTISSVCSAHAMAIRALRRRMLVAT